VIGRRGPLRASLLLWAGRAAFEHGRKRWARLSPEEQRELRRLLTASRGRPRNLSQTDQQELKRILRKLGEGEGQAPPPAPTAT
jgi:hypothetical protein